MMPAGTRNPPSASFLARLSPLLRPAVGPDQQPAHRSPPLLAYARSRPTPTHPRASLSSHVRFQCRWRRTRQWSRARCDRATSRIISPNRLHFDPPLPTSVQKRFPCGRERLRQSSCVIDSRLPRYARQTEGNFGIRTQAALEHPATRQQSCRPFPPAQPSRKKDRPLSRRQCRGRPWTPDLSQIS